MKIWLWCAPVKGRRGRAGAQECECVGQGEDVTFNVYFIKNNSVPTGTGEAIKVLL